MSDEHVANLADLTVAGILEVVRALAPPTADAQPAIEMEQAAVSLQCNDAYWLAALDATVQEQLGILQV